MPAVSLPQTPTSPSTLFLSVNILFSDLPVSQLLGFPLQIIRYANFGNADAPNDFSEALLLDVDVTSPSLGLPLQKPGGTALVVRKDLKPLHISQLKALIGFCMMLSRAFRGVREQESAGLAAPMASLSLVARFFQPQAFRDYFADMKKTETAQCPEMWEGVECPV